MIPNITCCIFWVYITCGHMSLYLFHYLDRRYKNLWTALHEDAVAMKEIRPNVKCIWKCGIIGCSGFYQSKCYSDLMWELCLWRSTFQNRQKKRAQIKQLLSHSMHDIVIPRGLFPVQSRSGHCPSCNHLKDQTKTLKNWASVSASWFSLIFRSFSQHP